MREAGLEPDPWNPAYPESVLLDALVGLARELGDFPTGRQLRLKREADAAFPTTKVSSRTIWGAGWRNRLPDRPSILS